MTSDSSRALEACRSWLAADSPSFKAVAINGEHGSGKTQLLMQTRALLEPDCRVLHVRCRSHEQRQRGALLRRILAQLCGHDVWPSLQCIMPMLSSESSKQCENAALLKAEVNLLRAHALAGGATSSVAGSYGNPHDSSPKGSPWGSPHVSNEFEAETGRREAVAASRLVLIVDDIHHADNHSCDMLKELAGNAAVAMLLITACRESSGSVGVDDHGNPTPDFAEGNRLMRALAAQRSTVSVKLGPLSVATAEKLACSVVRTTSLPAEVQRLLQRRAGGIPLLIEAIIEALEAKDLLFCDAEGCAELSEDATETALSGAAMDALIKKRHSVLCVKLSQRSMLQQLVLKAMSLLPEPCSPVLLLQAMPISIDMPTLKAQLRSLREHHCIAVSMTHRASLPGRLNPSRQGGKDETYVFVDIGMREVCEHLMVESQKRQIKLKVATQCDDKELSTSLRCSLRMSSLGDSSESVETTVRSPTAMRGPSGIVRIGRAIVLTKSWAAKRSAIAPEAAISIAPELTHSCSAMEMSTRGSLRSEPPPPRRSGRWVGSKSGSLQVERTSFGSTASSRTSSSSPGKRDSSPGSPLRFGTKQRESASAIEGHARLRSTKAKKQPSRLTLSSSRGSSFASSWIASPSK